MIFDDGCGESELKCKTVFRLNRPITLLCVFNVKVITVIHFKSLQVRQGQGRQKNRRYL
jgi:hypothetical protein